VETSANLLDVSQTARCANICKSLVWDGGTDIEFAQISARVAWRYRAYAHEQSPGNRGRYESEEDEARLRKSGLRVDAAPVPLWERRSAAQ
jgi:hypothetical protein